MSMFERPMSASPYSTCPTTPFHLDCMKANFSFQFDRKNWGNYTPLKYYWWSWWKWYLWVASTNLPQLNLASNQVRLSSNLSAKVWTIWGSIPPWMMGVCYRCDMVLYYTCICIYYAYDAYMMMMMMVKLTIVLSSQAGLPSLKKGTKWPMAATVKFFFCLGFEHRSSAVFSFFAASWQEIQPAKIDNKHTLWLAAPFSIITFWWSFPHSMLHSSCHILTF